MPYMIFNNIKTDKDYKTLFNGLVIAINYSNAGIIPTCEYIRTDLKNGAFLDSFIPNKEPVTSEMKNKLYLTVENLDSDTYCTLTTVLYVLGFL